MRERWLLGLLVSAGLLVVVLAQGTSGGPLAALERFTLDARQRWLSPHGDPADDIVIVGLDDDSLGLLEPVLGAWPWPRNTHGLVIDYLRDAGARAVFFDIMFLEPHGAYPGDDEALVAATHEAGNVFHSVALKRGADYRRQADALGPFTMPLPAFERAWPTFTHGKRPLAGLAEAARGLVATNLERDADGVLRRVPTLLRIGDRALPGMAWGAYLATGGSTELKALPLDDQGRLMPAWFADARPYPIVRFRDVLLSSPATLEEDQAPELDPAAYRDKIVFIGATAKGLHDQFATSIRPPANSELASWPLYGVEVHAETLDALRTGRYLRLPDHVPGVSAAAALLLAGLLALVVAASLRRSTVVSALALLLGTAVILACTALAFKFLLVVLPVAAPTVALFGVWGAGTTRALVRSRASRRHVQELFGRYLAPQVVTRLLEDENEAAAGGTRRTITVLFSDIRSFTSWSETRKPEEVVAQLNEYLSAMAEVVAEHGGYVDKFIGDAVMALWGVPLPREDHAGAAVAAAHEMLERLDDLNRDWRERGLEPFRIGIGLHSGEALVGNLGSDRKADYTAIGDTVNTASRLESMTKQLGHALVISEACVEAMPRRPTELTCLGPVEIRGREAGIVVFTPATGDGKRAAARPAPQVGR